MTPRRSAARVFAHDGIAAGLTPMPRAPSAASTSYDRTASRGRLASMRQCTALYTRARSHKTVIRETLGPYRVLEKLGEGGMGEVYRATDTRLHRDVAIKVLPAAFAQDPERVARLRREAQVLASLNHPHIAAIYGLEESDGALALAIELVDGEDLAERLAKRGAIPVEEATDIARQIAQGLEAAHEKGIVHRDLKPANVKIAKDGTVKILDFGLARAYEGDAAASGSSVALAHSPTMTRHATEAGLILGTAAYMAPEQARGTAIDKRADIWAFGVVFYELLTARRLFEGVTISDVLAAVLRQDVDLEVLPADTPPAVRNLIARCLERDPKQRLRDIGEARLLLSKPLEDPRPSAPTPAKRHAFVWRVLPWLLAVAAGIMLLVTASQLARPDTSYGASTVRVTIAGPTRIRVPGTPSIRPSSRWSPPTGG